MKLVTSTPPTTPTAAAPQDRIPGAMLRLYRRLFFRTFGNLEHGEIVIEEPYLDRVTRLGQSTPGALQARITITDPAFFRDVALRGPLGAGEAFVAGTWDSEDLELVIRLMLRNRATLDGMGRGPARLARGLLRLLDRRNANSLAGSRRNIAAHYDLGNDFFAAFLDPSMTYSSAIFDAEHTTLRDAQRNKLDRLCRKLDLRPDDHVLEIGTGWGSFAIHAARHYGCRVTTTTISKEQHAEARARVAAAGLDDRVRVLLEDYRQLTGQFDKLVSIEMVEAVGDGFLETWFEACSKLLTPQGSMAFQAITITDQHYARALREVDFIRRYIFPGSFIPSVTRLQTAATAATDMRMVHLEDFGPHYAETLRRWKAQLAERTFELRRRGLSAEFLRMWNYYLDYCAGGFAERYLGVAQLVFRKPRAELAPILGGIGQDAPARAGQG